MPQRLVILLALLCLTGMLGAQEDGGVRTHVSFEYGLQFPGIDLSDLYGTNFNLGSQFEVMLRSTLWHAGLKGFYIFGSNVKQDVLSELRTTDGFIIGNDRNPASVFLRERGFFIGPYAGKVVPLSKRNPHSGIKIGIGGGYLQHKIRIQDDTRSVVQITGEYEKGYDRLASGPALYTFVGYQHLSFNGRINFLIGADLTWGRVQNRRAFNFDEGRADKGKKDSLLTGLRIGWILPVSSGPVSEPVYY